MTVRISEAQLATIARLGFVTAETELELAATGDRFVAVTTNRGKTVYVSPDGGVYQQGNRVRQSVSDRAPDERQ